MRTNPDVAADADPNTGVAVYDPFDFGSATPWVQVGGTSLATPLWAGMAAIADQGRVLAGGQPLGATQMLTDLYNLAKIAPGDFHDITQGNNGIYSAGPGYDLVTGLGSPKANLLIPDLSAYGLASKATIVTQPPPSVVTGASFGIIAVGHGFLRRHRPHLQRHRHPHAGQRPGRGHLHAGDRPGHQRQPGGLPGPVAEQDRRGYKFQVAMTGLASTTTNTVAVTAPKSGVGYFYPLPLDNSLGAAVAAADSNSDASNIITLSVSSIPYPVTDGQLLVDNSSSLKSKTLTIVGQGETSSVINAGSTSRVFEIVGTNSGLSVVLQGLAIEGGRATDNGGLNVAGTGTRRRPADRRRQRGAVERRGA